MNNETKAILDKKDLNKVIMRWMPMAVNTYNYQYQQAGTVVYSLYPALRKIYKNFRPQYRIILIILIVCHGLHLLY